MHTLIAFASQWGSKFGGINAFNTDFLTAFSAAYNLQAKTICVVSSATPEEIEAAKALSIDLIPLPYKPEAKHLTAEHGEATIDELRKRNIEFLPDKTIWLGHDRITGAAANTAAQKAGGKSSLIHHMSYDHYESYAENAEAADTKQNEQTQLFRQADIVLAVGPLLRDAAEDRINKSKPVHMLIPGLAEIKTCPAPNTFTAFVSGRLTEDAARIKQGHLGIAAFAAAHNQARKQKANNRLAKKPKLVLRGVNFEQANEKSETELKQFAGSYADDAVINLQALPYTEDRPTLYNNLRESSVAMMPSWHEGFGLVAWEAIAARVPLILSENSGVYQLLEENHPGTEKGFVYPINVIGSHTAPYFHDNDLNAAVARLTEVANNPDKARKQANTLYGILSDEYTWSACAEQARQAFEWPILKGSIPENRSVPAIELSPDTTEQELLSNNELLQMPQKLWRAGGSVTDSRLLRAEEALVPFDPAGQPELSKLDEWMDDERYPQAIRLITGAGGLGKTRLALEACKQRIYKGWHAGLLESDLTCKELRAGWQTLKDQNKPQLIVIDYAETRQSHVLALVKAMIETPSTLPVRMLLVARDAGEWWDALVAKDAVCETLLSSYATSGPHALLPFYQDESQRKTAYQQALAAFASALNVSTPNFTPDLSALHFGHPLYLQMAALLALHGEQALTAKGLTKALLNHERRYWQNLFANSALTNPAQLAQKLLTLSTLVGGYATAKEAIKDWKSAYGKLVTEAEFNQLFANLAPLYPGKQGMQAIRPDLLGEALIADSLSHVTDSALLNTVLGATTSQAVRRHSLTVLARLTNQRTELDDTLISGLRNNLIHCGADFIEIAKGTPSKLPSLCAKAFDQLQPTEKSQVSGVLRERILEESIELAAFACTIQKYLVEKSKKKLGKKPKNTTLLESYYCALINYSTTLALFHDTEAAVTHCAQALEITKGLAEKNPERFEPDYATSLSNYSSSLSKLGQDDEALQHAKLALDIRQRLAKKNPDRFESHYADSLSNYANRLGILVQDEEALKHAKQALGIHQQLALKNPDRFEPDYATSLSNYAIRLSNLDQDDEALKPAKQALDIHQQLALKNPDRFEPDYADSLSNYAIRLDVLDQDDEALKHTKQALDIHQQLALKNPDRFEPHYADSLSNYAISLSCLGQEGEVLKPAKQALDIYQRLALINPDRFEPNYVGSLSNYANHLGDLGQEGEALKHIKQALDIYQQLALKNPARYSEALIFDTYSYGLFSWLHGGDVLFDLNEHNTFCNNLPEHRKELINLFRYFVTGCTTDSNEVRYDAFKQAIEVWTHLNKTNQRHSLENWICVSVWAATYATDLIKNTQWELKWREFHKQRQGNIPKFMLKIAERLEFEWPEVTNK